MISNKNMDKVSLLCHATVSNMFALFCNEKFRGEKFAWNNFPKMMASQCKDQVFLADIKGKNQQEIFEHAEKIGFEIANRMVKTAGFINE